MTDQQLEKIGVFLAVDSPMARQGAYLIMSKQADMEVVGQTGTAELLAKVDDIPPGTVVVVHAVPPKGSFDLVYRLREVSPEVSVIVVAEVESDEALYQAALAGASAFLAKGVSSARMLETVRSVFNGGRPIVRSVLERAGVASRILARFSEFATITAGIEPLVAALSSGEAELLKMVAEGSPLTRVGGALGVGMAALEGYGLSILRKLNVNERTSNAVAALYGKGRWVGDMAGAGCEAERG